MFLYPWIDWAGVVVSDIFISYARADRALAEGLAKDLTARGYRVWWDAELVGSDDFYEVILEALRQAKAAIVIWTKASAKSRFVRDEARFALHFDKLVALKEANLDVLDIPFGFQGQHTDDVTNREQIIRAVEKLGVKPTAAQQAGPESWESLKSGESIDEIVAFLGQNPPEPQRQAALARLKELSADPIAAEKSGGGLIRSLTMSNWQAFLSGLTFRMPKFQLVTKGIWTSIGAAIFYAFIILMLVGFLGTTFDLLREWLVLDYVWMGRLAAIITALAGWNVWNRVSNAVDQRDFLSAFIIFPVLIITILFVAVFAIMGTAESASIARELSGQDDAGVRIFWAIGTLVSIVALIFKIRTAR